MRELIIKRIQEIKEIDNFAKSTMRWRNFNVYLGNKIIHISEFDFNDADDYELITIFERIIKKYCKYM